MSIMIGHEDVAAEEVSENTAGAVKHLQNHLKFCVIEILPIFLEITGNEKILSVRRRR